MKTLSLVIITVILPFIIYSQEEEQLLVSELKQNTIISEPATLYKGFFKTGITCSFVLVDKIFTTQKKKEFVYSNGWGKSALYTVELHYGVSDRFQVSLYVPYLRATKNLQTNTYFPNLQLTMPLESQIETKGLSDIYFGADFQIIKGDKYNPAFTLNFLLTLPSGEKNPTGIKSEFDYNDAPGYGRTTIDLELEYYKRSYPYTYLFYFNYTHNFKGEKIMFPEEDEIEFKTGNSYRFGGHFSFLLNDWIAFQNICVLTLFKENKYYYDPVEVSEAGWSINYSPTIFFQIKKLRFGQGILIPLKGKYSAADPSYFIFTRYIF